MSSGKILIPYTLGINKKREGVHWKALPWELFGVAFVSQREIVKGLKRVLGGEIGMLLY